MNNKVFNFVQCKDKKFKWIWWALKVETSEEFASFIEVRSKGITEQYMKLKENVRKNYHITSDEQYAIQFILDNCKNRKTLVDDINVLSDKILGSYISFWLKNRILLINPAWGFRFLDDSVNILDNVVKEKFIFPMTTEKDIRIIQWRNGKHYYAKVGNTDVEVGGEQKWNSYSEAMKNAKLFLKEVQYEVKKN